MVVLFPFPVEGFRGDHGICSREEGVWSSSPKKEQRTSMVIFFPSSVESCGGGHGMCSS